MLPDYDRSKFSRVYVAPPLKPDGFDTAVRIAGGYVEGSIPRCRVVWGQDVTIFRNGNPKAVKYPRPFKVGPDRWILEAWRAPEFFGNETEWNVVRYGDTPTGRVDRIGPFPRNGMYVFVMPLCKSDGSYLPCDQGVIEFIELKRREFEAMTWKVYNTPELYAELQEEMAKEDEAEMAAADAEADEFYDYVMSNQEKINRNPAFSFAGKSLWTPDGEVTLH